MIRSDFRFDSFTQAIKGEHILLREYAFVSATEVNRRCFLQQVKKVFHTTPYYKVVTALDYHQMLCLICSDFPRSLILESARPLTQYSGILNPRGLNLSHPSLQIEALLHKEKEKDTHDKDKQPDSQSVSEKIHQNKSHEKTEDDKETDEEADAIGVLFSYLSN